MQKDTIDLLIHDIKSPLSTAKMYIDLLRLSLEKDASVSPSLLAHIKKVDQKVTDTFSRIRTSYHLLHLLNGTLDDHFTTIPVNEFCNGTGFVVNTESKANITLNIDMVKEIIENCQKYIEDLTGKPAIRFAIMDGSSLLLILSGQKLQLSDYKELLVSSKKKPLEYKNLIDLELAKDYFRALGGNFVLFNHKRNGPIGIITLPLIVSK